MPACSQVSCRRLDLGNPALTHPTCQPRTSAATDESCSSSMSLAELCPNTSSIIQKRTSTDPGSATGRPSPTTSARWGIASSRRVAGKIAIFVAHGWRSRLTLRQLPDHIFGQTIGARRDCRVGPGNFTPSLSPIRTGYSRIIRLVPSREGCRLPLNEGLLPANQLAQINGDDPPPSLRPHYRTFVATTRQSAPLRRFGTFGLAVGAACAFSVGIADQVLTFRTGA